MNKLDIKDNFLTYITVYDYLTSVLGYADINTLDIFEIENDFNDDEEHFIIVGKNIIQNPTCHYNELKSWSMTIDNSTLVSYRRDSYISSLLSDTNNDDTEEVIESYMNKFVPFVDNYAEMMIEFLKIGSPIWYNHITKGTILDINKESLEVSLILLSNNEKITTPLEMSHHSGNVLHREVNKSQTVPFRKK